MTKPALADPTPCRCGCGGTSRGQFVPGHDAQHKSALAKRYWTAISSASHPDTLPELVAGYLDELAAIRAECDAIDAAYSRPAGKWLMLIEKQAENLRSNEQKAQRREAAGTPVQRAKRRIAASTATAVQSDAAGDDGPTAAQARGIYIDDLMDRLARRPLVGQTGWTVVNGVRMVARIWSTNRDQGETQVTIKLLDSGVLMMVPADSWHRDINLERVS